MNDDRLRDAALALGALGEEQEARPFETRARILRTLHARRARRLTVIRVLLPMAAVFLGSVAWASATHKLPDAWYRFTEAIGITRGDPGNTRMTRPTPAPSGYSTVEPPAPLEQPAAPEVDEEPAPLLEEPPARPISAGAAGAEPAKPHAEASSAAAPPLDAYELYRTAHRIHFGGQSPSAALAAWEAYLAAAPSGRFATEAHYNRAICLVRLGRTAAAQRALEPFASGAFGGYRQKEARELLEALGNNGGSAATSPAAEH